MPARKPIIGLCVLALAALACGVSVDLGATPTAATLQLSGVDQISTMVALTVQAVSQGPSATPTSTATAIVIPSSTPVPAILSVSEATECYAGPSANYGFVITVRPGITVDVVGKDIADNSWIIDVPGYPGTVCWLSGEHASVSGDTNNLPAPATPAISIYTLSEPRNVRVSCTSVSLEDDADHDWPKGAAEWTIVLRWKNTDAAQTAVRIFRNGRRIATLGGHAGSYTEEFVHYRHHDVTYGVQVMNSRSVSSIVTVDVNHCN